MICRTLPIFHYVVHLLKNQVVCKAQPRENYLNTKIHIMIDTFKVILMESIKNVAINNVHLREIQESLARDEIKIPVEELLDIIIDLSAKNEKKILEIIKNRIQNSDFLLNEWLSTPVETDKTDAVHDHDLVI